jgi:hypothetical protein
MSAAAPGRTLSPEGTDTTEEITMHWTTTSALAHERRTELRAAAERRRLARAARAARGESPPTVTSPAPRAPV